MLWIYESSFSQLSETHQLWEREDSYTRNMVYFSIERGKIKGLKTYPGSPFWGALFFPKLEK